MKNKIKLTLFHLIFIFLVDIFCQVTVTSPNGGECWPNGTTRTVTWTAQGLWFVNLSYSTDGGNTWNTIASNIQNTGSYSWQIPQNICSKNCRVKVADILNPNIFDISNSNFSIVTSLSLVSPPSLISPSNGSNNQINPIVLRWNPVSCTDNYVIQVANNSSFTSPNEYSTNNTSYTLPSLTAGTTYYWRIRAVNCYGSGPYSNACSFTMASPPPAPTLISPSNGATSVTIRPNFSWNSSTGATSYKIQISSNNNFTSIIRERDNINSTSFQLDIDLNYNTIYYWRVNASNSVGTGNWSNIFSFTTVGPPPPIPTLQSPANDSYFRINQSVNFSWSLSTGANSYRIQISDNQDFNNNIVDEVRPSNNFPFTLNENLQMKRLFWRVRAGNNNNWSNWTSPWSIITLDKYEPNDNLIDPNSLPTISNLINQNVDVSINATIYPGSPQDMDFFRVLYPYSNYNNNINLTLDNLPANYNLYLIVRPDLNNPLNFKSENGGTSPENISVSIPKGYGGTWSDFFLVYVSGFGSSNPTNPYRLRVQITQGLPVNTEKEQLELPKMFKLHNNYPNPFNSSTTIEYHLPKSCFLNISIYNSLGVKIKTLVNEEKSAGIHKVKFEDDKLSSGIYFYQIITDEYIETKKMTLMR